MAIRRPPTTFSDSITGADLASDIAISTTGNIATTGSGTLSVAGTSTLTGALSVDTISEKTSANGVSIDGLKLKDYSLMYGSNIGLTVSSDGYILKPNQPAFQVKLDATKSAGTDFSSTNDIPFNTEIFDVGSNFNTSTETFTAPITGKYQLNIHLYLLHISANDGYIECQMITSNRNYYIIYDPNGQDATSTYLTLQHSVLADMDAGDTAKCIIVYTGPSFGISDGSQFSGYLVT